MALLTPLTEDDAARVADAWQLGAVARVTPIAAGSVNSSFLLDTARGRFFVRIYEEQSAEGAAFEWRLLDHLEAHGVPVARRLRGPAPGEVTVASKPVGVFECVEGVELCRRMVTPAHAAAVGDALARVHLASDGFVIERSGRFDAPSLLVRLAGVSVAAHPELADPIARLRDVLTTLRASALPQGIVHGDLFRDNVRWEETRVLAILDWESACRGDFMFDVAVALFTWAWGDAFDWPVARALAGAYHRARPLTREERLGIDHAARFACARFATTRITDYYLRGGPGSPGYRDYGRFLARLDAVSAMREGELAARLVD